MSATILDGKKLSAEIRLELKAETERLRTKGIVPGLAGILVGEDSASAAYISLKSTACEETGIREMMSHLPGTISQEALFTELKRLNDNPQIHGIFLQLPLPAHLAPYESQALATIAPGKDVDGFHAVNVGKAWLGQDAFLPAAAMAMQEILLRNNYDLRFKNVAIVNVDNMVGKPFASLLAQDSKKANVTLCFPDTPNLAEFTRRADVIVVSVNKPGFLTADLIKEGAVVLDFGANLVLDPASGKKKNVGDIDFEAVKLKASLITPVPGGIGPMLVTMLMANTVKAAKLAHRI